MADPDPDDFERHPELEGYERGDDRPLRHPMTTRVMKVVIVLGIAGLIVPGVVSTLGVQVRTAEAACQILVESSAPGATAAVVRFEVFGAEGPAWYCYARDFAGAELLLASLGLIPGLADPPVRRDSVPA
jgi:hypothetical protein